MRIAVVVSTYPPYKGGMGNAARDQVEALRRAGHEVTVFTPSRSPTRDVTPRPGVVELKALFRWGNSASVPGLFRALRGFDVVVLHYPFFGGAEWVWAWKAAFGRSARLVVDYHMDVVGAGLVGLIFRAYNAVFLKPILRAADRILVSSRDYAAASLMADWADDPKVAELPFSVDIDRFHPGSSFAKATEDKPTALFVGGLDRAHYFKGVANLIRAFAAVAGRHPTVRLALVGDGDLRPEYERLVAELGLADRIEFLGSVSDSELPDAYRRASFHVLPSVDRSEAFGIVTIEAAASGIPSIVSDLPGVRTIVAAGETGLVVPPGDVAALASALDRLFADPALVAALGAAARRRAETRYARTVIERAFVAAVVE